MTVSEADRAAVVVDERWADLQSGLSDKRRYPVREFDTFFEAVRRYVDSVKDDSRIHRNVASVVHGLADFLASERRRVPGKVLRDAERLECLLFDGYDPHFDGDEPPGL
jgi:hypothetical protein